MYVCMYVCVCVCVCVCICTGKSPLPRRHTWAKFSKSNIPLSGVGNFNGTASMVSMVNNRVRESFQLGSYGGFYMP